MKSTLLVGMMLITTTLFAQRSAAPLSKGIQKIYCRAAHESSKRWYRGDGQAAVSKEVHKVRADRGAERQLIQKSGMPSWVISKPAARMHYKRNIR